MSLDSSVWTVIVLALVGANTPFLSNRWFAVVPAKFPKSIWGRLFELVIFFFLVGLIALGLEKMIGQIYPQRWEFYATGAALFLTLAFPGFVHRYLRKHHDD
jgi:hypothetical protein